MLVIAILLIILVGGFLSVIAFLIIGAIKTNTLTREVFEYCKEVEKQNGILATQNKTLKELLSKSGDL